MGAIDIFSSGDSILCSQCGLAVLEDEAFSFGKRLICVACKPDFLQRLKEGGGINEVGVWRRKSTLILHVNSRLPDRCIRCNEQASEDTRMLQRLRFLRKSPYIGLLIGPPYTIHVPVPLCFLHYKLVKRTKLIGLIATFGSPLLVLAVCLLNLSSLSERWSLLLIGGVCAIGLIGLKLAGIDLLLPEYKNGDYLFIKLAKKPFLDSLEERDV